MRISLIFFLLTTLNLHSQINLSFNKRFVDCEDKWVAFKMGKDSTHTFGFIYIDEEAGLTFNYEGNFKLKHDNTYQIKKNKESNFKVRLEPNNVKVAIIPEIMYKVLKIDSVPEWLKYYKTDVNSVKRLYKWGFMYNGWNKCDKALKFLLKAKSIDANYKGLAVELAFSYNCLNDFDKALEILEMALKSKPTDAYINKEYIYTLINKKDIDKAVKIYKNSIKLNIENTYNAENCFNILGYYYKQKDLKNFKIWLKEFNKWPNSNVQLTKYIEMMKKELK